jgi:hypothetical protein
VNLSKLIAAGRVEPVVKTVPNSAGDFYDLQIGWQRKGSSRKHGEWTLRDARPWREPHAVLLKTQGAELVYAERKRQKNKEGFDADHDDLHNQHELGKAAVCYLLAGLYIEQGKDAEFVRTLGAVDNFAKLWPADWDAAWWKPGTDAIRCRVKAGALFWAEAARLKRAGITDKRLDECLRAVDAQVCAINHLLRIKEAATVVVGEPK